MVFEVAIGFIQGCYGGADLALKMFVRFSGNDRVLHMGLWERSSVGGEEYKLLNLDHPEVDDLVMRDMEAGVEVYYDRRWEVTADLTDWLGKNRSLFEKKRVLVLGAGVGAETLLLSEFATQVWINDLSPVAIKLCQKQLMENGFHQAISLVGTYQDLDLPSVDLVVASFLVYNPETQQAMQRLLQQKHAPLLLVNESLPAFCKLLKKNRHQIVFEKEGVACVLFTEEGSESN